MENRDVALTLIGVVVGVIATSMISDRFGKSGLYFWFSALGAFLLIAGCVSAQWIAAIAGAGCLSCVFFTIASNRER
jgi:Na+/melibiose symporter-like transporter